MKMKTAIILSCYVLLSYPLRADGSPVVSNIYIDQAGYSTHNVVYSFWQEDTWYQSAVISSSYNYHETASGLLWSLEDSTYEFYIGNLKGRNIISATLYLKPAGASSITKLQTDVVSTLTHVEKTKAVTGNPGVDRVVGTEVLANMHYGDVGNTIPVDVTSSIKADLANDRNWAAFSTVHVEVDQTSFYCPFYGAEGFVSYLEIVHTMPAGIAPMSLLLLD
ncbi:hypothetical protein [Desulfovibrio sp. DV]|uniref:hypothetical protein n=1 Tax=Desulfovibrio sp. DV TaxID=1844708 RepID=UPI000AFF51B2|nr:hypothetical protein [Desulfovibrio sp. DV]